MNGYRLDSANDGKVQGTLPAHATESKWITAVIEE